MALVAAVMANVHLACVVCGASVAWVALLAPRRRFLLAGLGAALFALAAILVALPGWLHNLVSLVQHHGADGGETQGLVWRRIGLLPWAAFAVVAWMVSFGGAQIGREYRGRVNGAIAVLVPFLIAFLVAPRFGMEASPKYLAHLGPACAVAVALPIGLVAGAALRRVSGRLSQACELITPFAVAVAIATPTAPTERTPTLQDLRMVARILHDERGWDGPRMLESAKAMEQTLLLTGLRQLGTPQRTSNSSAADRETAVLMTVEADDLPEPLPANWRVVRRLRDAAIVLVFMESRIDWGRFEVCVLPGDGQTETCRDASLREMPAPTEPLIVPGMPPAAMRSRARLRLRLPLRPAASGFTDEVFMPRSQGLCGGRIIGISDDVVHVDADGRHAVIPAREPGSGTPITLDLEWNILSPECDGTAYDGWPPLIVEGDAASVRPLEMVLRKREG